jgi:hypothetical protein
MLRVVGAIIALLLCPSFAVGQQPTQPRFWKGKLEIHQFNFSFGTQTQENKTTLFRGVDLWKYEYELYQNPDGVAREELTAMNRNRSVEGPLDIRLLDYTRGSGFVFDKGGKEATRGPLVPVSGRTSGSRRILGLVCVGTNYEWATSQHATVQLQSWRAQNSSFKVPLLEVEYFTDNTGALLALTITVVRSLEPVPHLPNSLFQLPPGLNVVEVPSVR